MDLEDLKDYLSEHPVIIRIILSVLVFAIVLFISFNFLGTIFGNDTDFDYNVSIKMKTNANGTMKLSYSSNIYSDEDFESFTDVNSSSVNFGGVNLFRTYNFKIPKNLINYLQLSFYAPYGSEIQIAEIYITSPTKSLTLNVNDLEYFFSQSVDATKILNKDTYIYFKISGLNAAISNTDRIYVEKENSLIVILSIGIAFIFAGITALFLKNLQIKENRKNILIGIISIVGFIISAVIYSFSAYYLLAALFIALIISAVIQKQLIKFFTDVIKQNASLLITSITAILILTLVFNSNQYFKTPKPTLSINNYMSFSNNYNEYFNKNNILKEPYNEIYNQIKTYTFNDSLAKQVIIGKNGWMFNYETVADYKKINRVADENLAKMLAKLKDMDIDCRNAGISFYLVIAPNKNTIYPEKMPINMGVRNTTSRLDQICEYITKYSDIKFATYIRDNSNVDFQNDGIIRQLNDAKNNRNVYYKTDTHWNQNGAFIAAQVLINDFISRDFDNIEKLKIENYDIKNDTTSMKNLAIALNLTDGFIEKEDYYVSKTNSKIEIISAVETQTKIDPGIWAEMNEKQNVWQLSSYINLKNPDVKNNEKLVMFRDSFAVNMIPFLNDSFSECTYIWDYNFDINLAIEEEATVVVYEIGEQYLDLFFN